MLLTLSIFSQLFSQERKTDSLIQALKNVKSIGEKLSLFDAITKEYINIDIELSTTYNDSLFFLSNQLNNKEMEMSSILNKAVIARMNGNYADGIAPIKTYINYKESKNDSSGLCTGYYQLASLNVYLSQYESAISNYVKSLSYLDKTDIKQQGKILNGMGIVFRQTSQYEKAKETYKKSIKLSIKAKDSNNLGIAYNSLGIALKEQDSIDKAMYFFKKSLNIAELTGNMRLMGYQYRNIGIVHVLNENYESAVPYLEKGLSIRKKMGNEQTIAGSLSDLANVYIETGKLNQAEKLLDDATNIFKKSGNLSGENTMYYYYGALEAKRGNAKKAFDYIDRHHLTRDSLENIELQERINDISIKYDSEKKEREIAEQQMTIAKQELSLAEKQRQLALWGGLGGVLAIILAVSFWLNKEGQKRKEQEITNLKNQHEIIRLESLVSGEEKERIRLAQDLHDGINGDLSVIKFKVDSLGRKKLNKGELETVENTLGMLDNAIDQVRRISHNLAPPSLQNFNLNEAIQQHLRKIQLAHQMDIDFQTFGQVPNFSTEQETALYRIVQELLNNIVKHAEATETLVQLNHTEEFTQLVIEDNGKGFDTKISQNGIGLQNIASRVAFLKGDLNIESSGEGSTFTVTLSKANIT
ncbi:tetratricopeptide repeat protein [Croceitalea marina]|uniref:Tetratricopeptide repeat protein n=1 Tax=Croceitalea marina TaxID=1775166 RepID=A0ABW5MX30_9FLAO